MEGLTFISWSHEKTQENHWTMLKVWHVIFFIVSSTTWKSKHKINVIELKSHPRLASPLKESDKKFSIRLGVASISWSNMFSFMEWYLLKLGRFFSFL